jgi:argininosuccinate lyase
LAEEQGVSLAALSLSELQSVSRHFGSDVAPIFSMTAALANRAVVGGTAATALREQLAAAKSASLVK